MLVDQTGGSPHQLEDLLFPALPPLPPPLVELEHGQQSTEGGQDGEDEEGGIPHCLEDAPPVLQQLADHACRLLLDLLVACGAVGLVLDLLVACRYAGLVLVFLVACRAAGLLSLGSLPRPLGRAREWIIYIDN